MNVAGKLMFDEPMWKHTSWRLGGPADRYYVPTDLQDLQDFLSELDPDIAVFWVGLGSNLLVRDGGIRGQVIAPLARSRKFASKSMVVFIASAASVAPGWRRNAENWGFPVVISSPEARVQSAVRSR